MRLIVVGVFIVISTFCVTAQSLWKVGIPVSISKSYLTGVFPSQTNMDACSIYQSTDVSQVSYNGGASLTYSVTPKVQLMLTLGYFYPGEFSIVVPGDNLPSLIIDDDGNQMVVRTQTQHCLCVKAQYATIQLTGRVNVWDNFHLLLGVGADVHLSSSLSQKFKIISAVDKNGNPISKYSFPKDTIYKYEDDGRTAVLVEQTPMSNAASVLYSSTLGIDYDVKISDGMTISPFFIYNAPLHSIRNDFSVKISSYRFGIQTMFDL